MIVQLAFLQSKQLKVDQGSIHSVFYDLASEFSFHFCNSLMVTRVIPIQYGKGAARMWPSWILATSLSSEITLTFK